jgi:glycosyltransferase-like protein
MSATSPALRIGLFTYATQARGGVVHTLELASALGALGHAVTVHAPDESGAGFFRSGPWEPRLFAVAPVEGDLRTFVPARIAAYAGALRGALGRFDVYHAQDGISANALATLAGAGEIPAFVRTIHHLDPFADAAIAALQDRAISAAAGCFVVSELWRDRVREQYGREATVVGNGVDTRRFAPLAPAARTRLRARLAFGSAPVFLAIGGVEERKNTLGIVRAFARVHAELPAARLVVAGGASVLDHRAYAQAFERVRAELPAATNAAIAWWGVVSDARLVELVAAADALVFPSLREGFGLVVLEALASGTPAVVSDSAPFTSYLGAGEALFVDPHDPAAIARAMAAACEPALAGRLRAIGPAVAARFPWRAVAEAHLPVYRAFAAARGGCAVA